MQITSIEQALEILLDSGIKPPAEAVYQNSLLGMPIQQFMATQCYLEKNLLMPTYPHVDLILDIMFYPEKYGMPHWFTKLYSTIKKSIKTTLSGIIGKWVCETWPGDQLAICLASDAEQAKGRGYEAFRETVEKHPKYNKEKRLLYGPNNETLWRITDKEAVYLPDGSTLKPVSTDYAGEAGANPTAIFITELWTWRLEKHRRFYAEMTIPPTRPKGFRFVDTYAGYRGESNVLWDIWQACQRDGIRLTADSMFGIAWNQAMKSHFDAMRQLPTHRNLPEWEPEDPPIYINLDARTIGYIDQGVKARRFKWQLGEDGDIYYKQEYHQPGMTLSDYQRLHENEWAEPVEALMPIQWWDNACDRNLPPEKPRQACVIGADASVTHDGTALTRHTRHPVRHYETVIREEAFWDPKYQLGGEMNYDLTILPKLVEWDRRGYNIVQIVYDKYQLKYLMDRVQYGTCGDIPMPDGSIATLRALPVRAFNQQDERRLADNMLVTMIRDRLCWHDGTLPHMRDGILQAAARHAPNENTKLKIEKRDENAQIDDVVAASMGNFETHRLGI